MHPYVASLKKLFEENASPSQAAPMKKYMRDQFEYLGIKSPQFKVLFRQHISEHGLPAIEELDSVVRKLWELPQREFQYAGMSLTERAEEKLPAKSIRTLEFMITHKSWWDTVDSVSQIVGVHFRH